MSSAHGCDLCGQTGVKRQGHLEGTEVLIVVFTAVLLGCGASVMNGNWGRTPELDSDVVGELVLKAGAY
jgi:hypothetical protein